MKRETESERETDRNEHRTHKKCSKTSIIYEFKFSKWEEIFNVFVR